jgi:CheY-like chemotaxis protein
MLPDLDGWRLMHLFKGDQRFTDIPVIVTTAATGAPPAGAKQYFSKPLRLQALLDAVENHCLGGRSTA